MITFNFGDHTRAPSYGWWDLRTQEENVGHSEIMITYAKLEYVDAGKMCLLLNYKLEG